MVNYYYLITEVMDYGPQVRKILLDFGQKLIGAKLNSSLFDVFVERKLPHSQDSSKISDLKQREITNLYICNSHGEPDPSGSFIALELFCHPLLSQGSLICFNGQFNVFVPVNYTIVQKGIIPAASGNIPSRIFNVSRGNRILLGELLKEASFSWKNTVLSYVYYRPITAFSNKSLPCIIWLHGAGEGGNEPLIAAIGNKAVNLISPSVQKIFGNAFFLAPQCPTMWMDNGTGTYTKDGTSVYTEILDQLIKNFLDIHPEIDRKRIYLGGCSNGGFMTLKLLLTSPNRYAAAFPVCEAYPDTLLSAQDIKTLARISLWFVHSKNDTVVPPDTTVLPTINRLRKAGAQDVHLTLYEEITDDNDFSYPGHWSWIPALNNQCTLDFDGQPVRFCKHSVTLLEWLAAHTL